MSCTVAAVQEEKYAKERKEYWKKMNHMQKQGKGKGPKSQAKAPKPPKAPRKAAVSHNRTNTQMKHAIVTMQ